MPLVFAAPPVYADTSTGSNSSSDILTAICTPHNPQAPPAICLLEAIGATATASEDADARGHTSYSTTHRHLDHISCGNSKFSWYAAALLLSRCDSYSMMSLQLRCHRQGLALYHGRISCAQGDKSKHEGEGSTFGFTSAASEMVELARSRTRRMEPWYISTLHAVIMRLLPAVISSHSFPLALSRIVAVPSPTRHSDTCFFPVSDMKEFSTTYSQHERQCECDFFTRCLVPSCLLRAVFPQTLEHTRSKRPSSPEHSHGVHHAAGCRKLAILQR